MCADSVKRNMHNWGHSRRKAKIGDLFTYLMPDQKYRFARFVRDDIPLFGQANMLYFYSNEFDCGTEPARDLFIPPKLILPPQLTNNLCWVRGYVLFVAHWPLRLDEVFPRHCFTYSRFKGIHFVDEFENPVYEPFEPLGHWALTGYSMIDLELSRALGIPHEYDLVQNDPHD